MGAAAAAWRLRHAILGVLLVAAGLIGFAAHARAASVFYIRGGGDGHGIGMSQYGAYGYALHGEDYRFILAHYYQGTELGTTDPNRIVRVLIADGTARLSGATAAGGRPLDPATTYAVTVLASGSLSLQTTGGRRIGSFPAPLTVTGAAALNVPGLGAYRGSLQFRPDGNGGVETVNALGLDDYVRGVISAEMPSSWAPAALQAQAVAARTYAITTTVGAAGYDLYPDTRSQMYRGVSAETAPTDAAVAATRGQIVTYDGQPAVTYFFASSGGYTENIENVWAGATPEPWLRGVPDPYDGAGGDPYHSWGYQMSLAAAAAKLSAAVKGSLIGIQVTRHGASPRILTAQVVGTLGRASLSGASLQGDFSLPTASAAFTTITSVVGSHSSRSLNDSVFPSSGLSRNLNDSVFPGSHLIRSLNGSVFPALPGVSIAVQVLAASGWHTMAQTKLGPGGGFQAGLVAAGSYRIVFGGLDGPPVSVS
jgi:stage II sporulation protein D